MRFSVRWRMIARVGFDAVGWPGTAGIVGLTIAAGLAVQAHRDGLVIPAVRERLALRRLTAQTDRDLVVARERAAAARPAADARLPTDDEMTPMLGELLRLADLAQISVPDIQCQLIPARDGQPRAYEISLPIKGRYSAIRTFITMALNTFPGLALLETRFKRQSIDQAEVDSVVKLALLLKAPSQR